MTNSKGTLTLLGSGETSSQGRKTHDYLMARLDPPPLRIALIETPAGFQPNAHQVYQKVGEFMLKSLQNFQPQLSYVQAHRKASAQDPDSSTVVEAILDAQYIFSGPGSPTYAARNLRDTLALRYMAQAFAAGATVALSSAAAIAAGSHVMRVYEIFKAGADLGWDEGTHLLPMLGLDIDPVIVSHWNNAEGGTGLDTTHCYVGADRYERLIAMLPPGTPILGIDEHTAVILAPNNDARVMGAGSVTVIADGQTTQFSAGASFPLAMLKGALAV